MSLYRTVAEDGMTLRMPAGHKRVKTCVSAFRGAEDLPASEAGRNLSPRRLPAAASRRPRGLLMTALGSGVPHGMAIFGGDLYFVRGTTLYRMDDDAVIALGTVSDTDKHFFVFGERLYVYPDKLYVQAGEMVLRPMELDTGVLTGKTVFKGSTVTLPSGMTWSALGFAVGDCLRVVNRDDDMPAPEGYYRLVAISGRAATVAESFPVTYESIAQLRRVVPDLDGVCVSGDRVYGFAGKDVYAGFLQQERGYVAAGVRGRDHGLHGMAGVRDLLQAGEHLQAARHAPRELHAAGAACGGACADAGGHAVRGER